MLSYSFVDGLDSFGEWGTKIGRLQSVLSKLKCQGWVASAGAFGAWDAKGGWLPPVLLENGMQNVGGFRWCRLWRGCISDWFR